MILKPKAKTLKKKNLLQKLLILYFFFTFSIVAMFLVLFFSSYTAKVKSSKLLDYLSRGGRIEYINIFKISWMALQSKFKKFEYSTASLYLKNINVINFHKKWITDESSKIYLDNSSVGKIIKEIIPMIYEKDINLLNKTSN